MFAVTPTIVLLATAEATVRVKYFLSPLGHDWRYLTTTIGRGSAPSVGDRGRDDLFTDLGHLTARGDRMVGELIAAGLQLQ